MKLLGNCVLPASLDFKIPAGMYRKFLFQFQGTAGAGLTIVHADLGTILVTYRGRQIQRIAAVAWLNALNNLEGGVDDITSGAGAAFSFSYVLNQFYRGDSYNVLDVRDDDNVRIQWQPGATLAAQLAPAGSGTLNVYGQLAFGNQVYVRQLFQHDSNISAATLAERMPYENIKTLFVENDVTNLTRLSVNVDNQNVCDATRLSLLNETHQAYNIETYAAGLPLLAVGLSPTGNLIECLNDETVMIITGGGITVLTTLVEAIDFTPDAYERSKSATLATYNQKVAKKASLGKTRPVQYLSGNVFNTPMY